MPSKKPVVNICRDIEPITVGQTRLAVVTFDVDHLTDDNISTPLRVTVIVDPPDASDDQLIDKASQLLYERFLHLCQEFELRKAWHYQNYPRPR